MTSPWTLPLLAAAGLSALRAAAALPTPAYAATGVRVGEDEPTLAYAGAGTLQNGLYTAVYDDFGDGFHTYWPLDGPWNAAELLPWRSSNEFRTNWKPGFTRREIPIPTPVDLRTAYRCEWKLLPGNAAVSVPVGVPCSPDLSEPQDHTRRVVPTSEHHSTAVEPVVPESDASASGSTTSLPPYFGEAAQLVMERSGSGVTDRQPDGPISGGDAPAASSRRRRQVSRMGRRGASSSAAAASASSGPWGSSSSASAAAASAASGGRGRPAYGYRPGYYRPYPAYGRPFRGQFYG